jgi:hypothetical protein
MRGDAAGGRKKDMLAYDPATKLVAATIGGVTRVLDADDLAMIGTVVVHLAALGRTVEPHDVAMLFLDEGRADPSP